jgi:DNA-binding MarR family transcriptional regulator
MRRVLSVAQIRDELGVPQATTSAWLDEAEAETWVARQREAHGMPREHRRRTMRNDNLDGRRHIVMLTAKGKQLLRRRRGTAQEPTP